MGYLTVNAITIELDVVGQLLFGRNKRAKRMLYILYR